MTELRNATSRTSIPRTGIVIVTRVVDLGKLREEHGESIPVDAIEAAGTYEITLDRRGKPKRLATAQTEDEAQAFVAGFKSCADVRRVHNRKKGSVPS